MPTPGLSLCGFLSEQDAILHLQTACVPANPDPAVLRAEWLQAQTALGAPIPKAGSPAVRPIPQSHAAYVTALEQLPWVAAHLAMWPGYSFQMVEVDPLLAFQVTVDSARSQHHCGGLAQPPTLDELFGICLPNVQLNEAIHVQQQGHSTLLKARSLNVRLQMAGFFQNEGKIGIQFGVSLGLAHVVRFNGRYYLHNGFHRAVGARLAGATMIPCIVRDVATFEEVGGSTFPQTVLEGANPPTVGHYAQGRAHRVQLRSMSRILQVSWTDYVVPDE